MPRTIALIVVLAIAAAGVGCGSDSSTSTTGATAGGASSTQTAPARTKSPPVQDLGSAAVQAKSNGSPVPTNANGAPLGSNTAKRGDNSIQTYGFPAQDKEKAAVIAAMRSYLKAIAERNWAKVCAGLAERIRAPLEQAAASQQGSGGCTAVAPGLVSKSPAGARFARHAAKGKVAYVRIGGDNAFVVFRLAGGSKRLYYLVFSQEDGGWKSLGLSTGTPLHPDLPQG